MIKKTIFSKLFLLFLLVTIIPVTVLFFIITSFYFEDVGENITKEINKLGLDFVNMSDDTIRHLGQDIIQQKARDVAKQAEIFLISEPDVSKLKGDSYFENIVTASLGDRGYNCLYECNTGIMRFHPNSELIDRDMSFLKEKLPDWWAIYEPSLDCVEVSGYYDWLDPDGIVREKYMTMAPINNTTYMIAATTYIDEFLIPEKEYGNQVNNHLGNLTLFFSQVRNQLSKVFFFSLLIIFLLSGFISYIFSRTISKPMVNLSKDVQRISKGNFQIRTKIKSNDELGTLSDSINMMARDLYQSQMKLEKYNSELENAVKKKTKSLHQKVKEVENSKTKLQDTLKKLKESLKKQKQLEKIKTEFLSVTSHELRTPITPMKAQLQMVLGNYFGKVNKKQKNSLEMVLNNTMRLDRLIGDILDVSKLESGNMKFIMEKYSLRDVIKQAVDTMQLKAESKGLKIIFRSARLPKFVFDKDRITQVVENLLSNGIKFSDPNGNISVRIKKDKDMAVVYVRDRGIGIPSDSLKRIFRPFEQVDSSMGRNFEGTGLGLAITRGIVENHGGRIWVESKEGKGSEFIFTIPYKKQKQYSANVELFNFNKEDILNTFRKKIIIKGYELVFQKSDELLLEGFINDKGHLRYNLTLSDLENDGFIKKIKGGNK